MQFTITQAELLSALTTLKAACKGRFTLPILNNVLIEVNKHTVRFTTTDLTMRIMYTANTVKVSEDGSYTVDFRQLLDTIKGLPRQADIAIRRVDGSIEIMCAGRKFVRGMDSEEYPIWQQMRSPGETYTEMKAEYEGSTCTTNTYDYEVLKTETQRLRIPRDLLMGMVSQVAYASAKDGPRPILQAICTELQDDRLLMVTGDSFRLVKHVVDVPCAGTWERPLLLDAKYVAQIAKLLPKGPVEITALSTIERTRKKNGKEVVDAMPFLNMAQIHFKTASTVVSLRPITGTYPNYNDALPTSYRTRIVCKTTELLSGYQAIWPVARNADNVSTLRIEGGMTFVEASMEGQPKPTVHEVPALVSGPDTHMLLNCQYMLDFLKTTKALEVEIELATPGRPIVLRSRNDELGEQTEYVVMSMRTNR